ncbi:MAG: DUF4433 domain-containing protein [Planctomycetes bacterium]|nr:DUF4433 domain-containing protein [Planctomycetota bacterium]
MPAPIPTPIFRFIHIDNLHIYLRRGGIYAPNNEPADGLRYRANHNIEVQDKRRIERIPCGPKGVIHDYVPFYFGYLSPMMLQLKTGQVPGYSAGQEPLIYLVSTAQKIQEYGTQFVFSDGHGLASFTQWFDDLGELDKVDWNMVYERYWKDEVDDSDRQRRKQAEFLVHRFCDWSLIQGIAVIDIRMEGRVKDILSEFSEEIQRTVRVQRDWYYY